MKRTLCCKTILAAGAVALGAGCGSDAEMTRGAHAEGTAPQAIITQVGGVESEDCSATARFLISANEVVDFVSFDAENFDSKNISATLTEIEDSNRRHQLADQSSSIDALRRFMEERRSRSNVSSVSRDTVTTSSSSTHEESSMARTTTTSDRTSDVSETSRTSVTRNSESTAWSEELDESQSENERLAEVDSTYVAESEQAQVRSGESSFAARQVADSAAELIDASGSLDSDWSGRVEAFLGRLNFEWASERSDIEWLDEVQSSRDSNVVRSRDLGMSRASSAAKQYREAFRSDAWSEVIETSKSSQLDEHAFDEHVVETESSSADTSSSYQEVVRELDSMSDHEIQVLIEELEAISEVLRDEALLDEEAIARSHVFADLESAQARVLELVVNFENARESTLLNIFAGSRTALYGQEAFPLAFGACKEVDAATEAAR